MIQYLGSLIIQDLGDSIPSVRNGCHTMKKICAFITQFYPVYCVTLAPVKILVVQPHLKLLLDCIPEVSFLIEKPPSIF